MNLLVQDQYASAVLDAGDCRAYCQSSSYRFASVYNDTCSCGDGIENNFERKNDELCDVICSGYDERETRHTVFCGGRGSLSSVFVTVGKFLQNWT